ncbi:unnamed protein product [Vicia faba]|uniref:Uncharacterized protein n=1 Tax=Vicia faba TaxID=3906 RepID=A0AAV1A8S0_VICFA|nr:unnamed protein product [Vicia faba]
MILYPLSHTFKHLHPHLSPSLCNFEPIALISLFSLAPEALSLSVPPKSLSQIIVVVEVGYTVVEVWGLNDGEKIGERKFGRSCCLFGDLLLLCERMLQSSSTYQSYCVVVIADSKVDVRRHVFGVGGSLRKSDGRDLRAEFELDGCEG